MTFEEMVAKYDDIATRWLTRLSGDSQLAADTMQNTYVRLWRARDAVTEWHKALLFTAAYNTLLDYYRTNYYRRGKRNQVAFDLAIQTGLPDPGFERLETRLEVAEVLEAIPEHYRELLVRLGTGLSYLEISEELGVPLGTVKSRLNYARQKALQARWQN